MYLRAYQFKKMGLKLEQQRFLLSVWIEGNGQMETSAVWLDHIACNKAMAWCSGFEALDDIQVWKGPMPRISEHAV